MIKTSKLFLAAAGIALASSASFADDDKIVIGGALSMTGIQAPLDTPGYNGAQVAVKFLTTMAASSASRSNSSTSMANRIR